MLLTTKLATFEQINKVNYYIFYAHLNQSCYLTKKSKLRHAQDVGKILYDYEFPADIVIAGYLHDVIECTGENKIEEITRLFGKNISNLVLQVTESTNDCNSFANWLGQKINHIESLKNPALYDEASCYITLAEKLAILQDLSMDSTLLDSLSLYQKCELKAYFNDAYEILSLRCENTFSEKLFRKYDKLLENVFETN